MHKLSLISFFLCGEGVKVYLISDADISANVAKLGIPIAFSHLSALTARISSLQLSESLPPSSAALPASSSFS